MNVGSLFSGIGGFDLGFERAGMRVDWQVELDPYCRAVLARHFPEADRFEDVREVGIAKPRAGRPHLRRLPLPGPQRAGRGAGIDGARSGLWVEFARIVRELRPRYVVVENVPALLTGKGKRWERGPIGRVLGDLAEARYDAEWACLSAGEFGAPHLRKRVWIVAYPARDAEAGAAPESRAERQRARAGGERSRATEVADADAKRQPGRAGEVCNSAGRRQPAERGGKGADVPDADRQQHEGRAQALGGSAGSELRDHWAAEPAVGRVADGVPHRVDRLAALGNALVPQIAEWIGCRIFDYERAARRGAVS